MVAKKETKEAERKKKNETKEAIDTKKKDINSKKEDIIQETIVKTIQEVHVTKVESPQTESENDLKENTAEILESESIMNSSQETKADVDRFPEKNNDEVGANKSPVSELAFKQERVENVEGIQDLKDGIIEAANFVVQKVVDKIENEIESKVEKEEKEEKEEIKEISKCDTEKCKDHSIEKQENVETAKLQHAKDQIADDAKPAVQIEAGHFDIDTQIESGKEKAAAITENPSNIKIEKDEKNDIAKDRIPVFEPVFIQEHIEPLGSIEDVQDDIIDAAKSVVQKVVEKIDNTIELKVEDEESKDIIETDKEEMNNICKERIPIFEPEFVQEHIEPLGSIQDVQDGIIDAAKSVVQKIDNTIVQKVEEEEAMDIIDTENADNREEETIDESITQNNPVNEPIFKKENVEAVESLRDVKDDLVQAAKSVVQKVVTKIDKEITNKVEKEEMKDMIKVPVKEPAFKEEICDPIETTQSCTETGPHVGQKEESVNNESECENQKVEVSTVDDDAVTVTDNIAKLQAPSFTQLLEEAVKEDDNECNRDIVPAQDTANGEDYYWITVGSFGIAIIAVFGSFLYYYLN